jgi:uncharacterized protein (TIGR02594 family)
VVFVVRSLVPGAGRCGRHRLGARPFVAGWGEPLAEPRPGCITVLWRESPDSWKGHVGFYLRHDAAQVWLLGGNQLGRVCENAYPLASVLAYRWPAP